MTSVWTGEAVAADDISGLDHLDYMQLCQSEWFGGSLIYKTHPVPGRSARPCVDSGFGMWNEKIYHFKPDQPPSSAGDEIQTELFVKYADLPDALADLYANGEKFRHLVQITEIRAVLADDIPLSPAKD